MGWQNVFATLLQAGNTTVINGTGVFVYAGVPALGNLIVSIATAAGTDAVGNSFPQGLNVTQGQISGPDYIINSAGAFFYSGTPALGNLIVSIAGAAGTDGFGNTYPQGLKVTKGQISGPDYIINSAGEFFYSGTPAAGNLIYSVAQSAGTDSFGNNYLGGGETTYDNTNLFALNASGYILNWFTMTANPGAVFTNCSQFAAIGTTGLLASFGANGFQFNDVNTGGQFGVTATSHNIPNVNTSDGNVYTAGEVQLTAQAIGVPSNVSFTQFKTFSVENGVTYDLYVRIGYSGNQNAGAPIIGFHGGSLAFTATCYGYTQFGFVQNAVYNNVAPSDRTGPTLSTGAMLYETRIRFTANGTGTMGIAGACSVAGDTWNMLFLDMRLRPLT